MSWRSATTVALVGAMGTAATALALDESALARVKLTGLAAGVATLGGLIGASILRTARHRSISAQSAIVTLTSVAAMAAGAMAASHLMLLSTRPIAALGVVLISSGTVGVLISLILGARVRTGSRRLMEATRRIGHGDLQTSVGHVQGEEFDALARELEAMQARLELSKVRERQLEEARRELVTWISHDLRTPLARMRLIADAVTDELVAPDEVSAYCERMRLEADRVARLVDDLFELNRISAGGLELEFERTSLVDIVSDAVASFSVIAHARGIHLHAPLPEVDAAVDVSPPHLERALANLLDNAFRYTARGGTVDVGLARVNGHVSVAIADTCGETDVWALKKLLASPQEQLHGRRDGSGVGLSIAKGLVEAQSGEIGVESSNRGCVFTLSIPLAAGERQLPGLDSNQQPSG